MTKETQPKTFPAKLMELRRIMSQYKWEKDGINRHQQYKYISEAQYKKNFQAALLKVGLDYKFDAEDFTFVPNISDKMHLIIVRYTATIFDPDNLEERTYKVVGAGADNGDKAVYKAETGAIKYFLSGNFLVAEDLDPESDTQEIQKEKPAFKTPEQKAEIKQKITDQSAPATPEQLDIITEAIEELVAQGKNEEATAFAEVLAGEPTKADAESIIEALGELLQ